MIKVIGVRFRNAGKIYYFDPAGREIHTGDHVIVETARGIEYGYVVLGSREVPDDKVVQPLKSVIRMASKEDEEVELKNHEKERKRSVSVRKDPKTRTSDEADRCGIYL